MVSKFGANIWMIIIMALGLFCIGIFFMISKEPYFSYGTPMFFRIAIIFSYVYMLLFLTVGELRTQVIKVVLHKDWISKSSFLGFGKIIKYSYKDFDGYLISDKRSKSGTYEYLYLIMDNKKIIKLSQYYHKNYEKLKVYLINRGVPDLGYEESSFLRDAKELFD